jgi:hypothetical protein
MITYVNPSSTNAQTHLAIWQSKRECLHEYLAAWEIEHSDVSAIFLWFRISPVGSEVFASRHANTLIFDGTFMPQFLGPGFSVGLRMKMSGNLL